MDRHRSLGYAPSVALARSVAQRASSGVRSVLVASVLGALTLLTTRASAADETCADVAERAQDLRSKGKLLDARKDLLQCANERCPKVIRRDCVQWLEEVQRSLPAVTIVARHRGKDVAARVRIDGALVEGTAPVALDPGPHTVDVEAAELRPGTEPIVVRAGETARVVVVEPEAFPAPAPRPEAPPPSSGRSVLGPAILGAVGVVGLATFAAFQGVGRSQIGDIEDGCGRTFTCTQDDLGAPRTSFVVSAIGLGVGAAALATAIVWYVVTPRAGAPTTATAPFLFRF